MPKPRFWLKPGYQKAVLILVLAAGLVGFLSLASAAKADFVEKYVFVSLAKILEIIASLIVSILLWVINYIIILSGYNNFLNARVVSIGWSLTRDVANMFYILVMLIIAFGTMFKIEQYSWKKLLPRLLITAVLVNFSKTIVGLFIDFAQVIMLTFVNGYAAVAGGNFITMFGLDQMFKVSTEGARWGTTITSGALLGFLLGAVLLGVALIVTAVFAAILLFRIIILWVLIVLAPLAFLLGTFPKGQEYYADWWKRLTNQIIVGPVIAFFLWLSLAAMGGGNQYGQLIEGSALSQEHIQGAKAEEGVAVEKFEGSEAAPTDIAKWENLGSFAVSIAMLFVALQFTQQLGVAGAGLASGASGWMKSKATAVAKKVAVPVALGVATGGVLPGLAAWGGLKLGKVGARKAGYAVAEGTMGLVGKFPIVGGMATRAKATLKAQRLAKAREGAKNVSEFTPEEVLRESQRTALTDKAKQMKFAAQERVLKDPDLMKRMSTPVLGQTIAGFKKFGEDTGNAERANSVLKELYKQKPQFLTDTPTIPATKTTPAMPAKTREQNIQDNFKKFGRSEWLKIDENALADPVVARNVTLEGKKAIFEDGSAAQKANLGEEIIIQEAATATMPVTKEQLRNPSDPANTPAIQAAFGAIDFSRLPDGILNKLNNVFSVLAPALQTALANLGKMKEVTANNFAGTGGENLAGEVALRGKEEVIQQVQTQAGPDFKAALDRLTVRLGPTVDPRMMNVFASMQRSTVDMLNLFRTGRFAGQIANASKAANSHMFLKNLKSDEIANSATGNATTVGKDIYKNIPISSLAKIISEANKTGSPEMKEVAATLTALVKKSMDAPAGDPNRRPAATSAAFAQEKNSLNSLLKSSNMADIDWNSKYSLVKL